MNNSNWTYESKEFTEDMVGDNVGFVYCITNTLSQRKYIGKKLFKFSKTKRVKGRNKKSKITSDWENYFGSNDELKADVEKHGKDYFKREIVHLCKSKGECNYMEAKEQFNRCVLESNDYYNTWIMVKVRDSHIRNIIKKYKITN